MKILNAKSTPGPGATVPAELTDERCPSGIAGLDDILAGGLPRECFYLVQGRVALVWRVSLF